MICSAAAIRPLMTQLGRWVITLIFLAEVSLGCREETAAPADRSAKPTASPAVPAAPHAAPAPAQPVAGSDNRAPLPAGHPPITPTLQFEVPSGWTEQPAVKPFRKRQFLLPAGDDAAGGAELVLYYFGKDQGGSVEMNIDRWLGMFSAPDGTPISRAQANINTRLVNGLKVTTLDVRGRYTERMGRGDVAPPADHQRMLAAIIETLDGPWFFKVVGSTKLIDAHQERFAQLTNSVHP